VRNDRERIYDAPAFEYARINEYASYGWINNVYSCYGVSSQAGAETSATPRERGKSSRHSTEEDVMEPGSTPRPTPKQDNNIGLNE
jgi:hypothetical protein